MFHNIKILLLTVLICLLGASHMGALADTKKFTVVIDAGHGGKDIGATDNGVMEKNINLKVAKQLESLIKKKMKNTRVIMTRDDDTYLTLQQRADKANKSQGDIFISIHTNSVDKKNRNRKQIAGSSVYTLGLHKDDNNLAVAMRENSVIELEQDYEKKYSGFDPQRDESYIIFEMAQKKNLSQSIHFAETVEKELVNSGRKNRGVHQAGFWVLWATSMPSVLVELDFICNPESAKYMASDKGSKELAEAIFKALQKYEDSWKKTNNIPASRVSDKNSELSDTYIAGSESNLEETYQEPIDPQVGKARLRSRTKSVQEVKTDKEVPIVQLSDKRRRRSNRSKELSMSKNYEQDNLEFSGKKSEYGVIAVGDISGDDILLTSSPSKDKTKNKSKIAEKKKKPKEEKPKISKEQKKRRDDAHNGKINKLVTVYKIQILASTDLLSQGSSRFCGLSPISTYKENDLYKYYYAESTDRREIESVLTDVRKKIPDAFIVSSQKSIKK